MLLHVWDTVCLSMLKVRRKSAGKTIPVALFLITIFFTGLFSALFLHEMLLANGLSLPTGKLDCVHRMSWCLPFSVYVIATANYTGGKTDMQLPPQVMMVTCPPNRFCLSYWKDKGKQSCKDSPFFIVSGCSVVLGKPAGSFHSVSTQSTAPHKQLSRAIRKWLQWCPCGCRNRNCVIALRRFASIREHGLIWPGLFPCL